ncbi:MAG: hypothetical protein KGL53_12560, partial [Elusimicrobia bacterium]|nr:hypothetical protein [Elusimicrobiota bacterium]
MPLSRRAGSFLLCLAGAALFWAPWLSGARVPFYDTLLRLFYPAAEVLRRALARGEFPFWDPFRYSGLPYLADPQHAVLYPPTLLYALLPFARAMPLDLCLHTALAAFGMLLWAEDLGASAPAAALAAAAFALNGYAVGRYAYPSNVHAYAWAPLVLLWAGRAGRSGSLRDAATAALLLSVQAFAGFPQTSLLTLAAAGAVWAAYGGRKASQAALVILGSAAASAAQWVPTLLAVASSARVGMGASAVTAYSLSPHELLRMLVLPLWDRFRAPAGGDPHILGFYAGLPVLLLAALAPAGERPALRRALGALAAAGLLLSLGSFLPGSGLLFALPPLRWLRFPPQYLFLTALCLPPLAAAGCGRLAGGRRGAGWALAALCAADLFLFGRGWVESLDASVYAAEPPTASWLAARDDGRRVFMTPRTRAIRGRRGRTRLEAWLRFKDSLTPDVAAGAGLRDADGVSDLRTGRYQAVLDALSSSPLSPWMDALSVRWLLTLGSLPPPRFRLARA